MRLGQLVACRVDTGTGVCQLLSEHQVIIEWRKLFHSADVTAGTIHEAQHLLEQMSPESPLRVRLGDELTELNALVDSKRKGNAKRKA